MTTPRRRWLAGLAAQLAAVFSIPRAGAQAASPTYRAGIPPLAAGQPGRVDLSAWLPEPALATTMRLRANIAAPGARPAPLVSLQGQCPELRLEGTVLHFDGGRAGASQPGASSVRFQVETQAAAGGVVLSDVASLRVDSPLAHIRHGLDRWDSFEALARDVAGGRSELIGATFEVTPGMFSEGVNGRGGAAWPAPVATIHFPCTVKALDPQQPPVFRSVTGQRDIIQIEAQHFPPMAGEVVLQDLVIRDNRGWYDTGEAGVRIKDRWPGRSVRIERCEFVRCQNAVAGGVRGQRLQVIDCRIVDCGLGAQAHSLYVQTEWLDFHGNVVLLTPGNRLARAHLLKTRALHSRILGNRFEMPDATASFMVDAANGGEVELAGNWLLQGTASDNRSVVLVAYGSEGADGDAQAGARAVFSAGRRFSLVLRHNTLVSAYAGRTTFVAVHEREGTRAEGGSTSTRPAPLVVQDNVIAAAGAQQWVVQRGRLALLGGDDLSPRFADNTHATLADAGQVQVPASTPGYAARRFTGHTRLGTGSAEHVFRSRGAQG
jgi:hypothetical protein